MNYNFELIEIMHLASQAIMSNDDTVKRIALGDIYHAVKSAIRGTSAATEEEILEAATEPPVTVGCPSLVPPRVIPHDEPAAEVPRNKAKDAAKRGEVRAAKTPMTVVFQTKVNDDRVLSAEINSETADHRTAAYLFDGPHVVCKIEFFDQYQGRNWAYLIVRRALNGLMSKAGKAARHRKLAAKRLTEQRGKDSAAPVEEEANRA